MSEALKYHTTPGRPGKLAVTSTKPLSTQHDLSLAYTPGVAEPVLEIARDPALAYEYTNRGNLVAVVSNGTAILGLGDRGALASKPVMEGKAVLFKKFAGVDAIDIEVDSKDPDEIVRIVTKISPSFGGINLEDIKAPECFQIERRLVEALDIPVFHDDQHGTAIIVCAGLINALELAAKKPAEIKVVFSGAGSAAVATANLLVEYGIPREHIWMTDVDGLLYNGRPQGMFPEQAVYAHGETPLKMADLLEGADVFIGLSAANLLTGEMIKRMSRDPIIFAMANPVPEIGWDEARAARPDALLANGRSDSPNQVNNLLAFPYIFRAALDCRARRINTTMKLAAARALAELCHQSVPQDVLSAYNLHHLAYGRDWFIPKPLDRRLYTALPPVIAKAAVECGEARIQMDEADYRRRLSIELTDL
ncbi:MAG: malate dehydrogenase [Leptolinea sp.]|jgi:malate dehydrogenase (oxaloacetate-decarboxylating)(NADP+)|nr:malate dehydrogenase [Leptolinea sp.]